MKDKYSNPYPSDVEKQSVARAEVSNKKFTNKTLKTSELREKFPQALTEALAYFKVTAKEVRDWGVIVYADNTVDIYGWR